MSCLALTCLSARSLPAQAVPALPFRPGQWGAEFSVANQSVGTVLRFHTPDRAWAFGGSANGTWVSNSENPPGDQSLADVSLRISLRRYRPLTTDVVGYWALGGSAGISHGQFASIARGRVSGGPFAQVGASWFILPRLSVGADAAMFLTASRIRERETAVGMPPLVRTATSVGFTSGLFGLVGALYF